MEIARTHPFDPVGVAWARGPRIREHNAMITLLIVSPNGEYIASGDEEGYLCVRNHNSVEYTSQFLMVT